MPLRRPLPTPPSPAAPAAPAAPTPTASFAQDSLRPHHPPDGHSLRPAQPQPSVAQLVHPLASLTLDAPRRPTPLPRLPSTRRPPRMTDGTDAPGGHEPPLAWAEEPAAGTAAAGGGGGGGGGGGDQDAAHYHHHHLRPLPSPGHPTTSPRPLPVPRNMSFSKRHASFDTPREVPLPSPSSQRALSPVGSSSSLSASLPVASASSQYVDMAVCHPSEGEAEPTSPDVVMSSRASSPLLLTPEDMEEFHSLVGPLRTNSTKGKERAAPAGSYLDIRSPRSPRSPRTRTQELQDRYVSAASASGGLVSPTSTRGPPPPYTPRHPSHPADLCAGGHEVYAPTPVRPDRTSTQSLPLHEPYQTLPSIMGRMPEAFLYPSTSSSQRRPGVYDAQARLNDMVYRSSVDWRAAIPTATAPQLGRSSTAQSAPEPPEPPRVLTPPPPPERALLPHETFLCHGPPPPDAWIAVETTGPQYILHCNLPGIERDHITISARRRRVLHIAADGFDTGGGHHFERRIKFGHDADLGGVGAEFDGDRLRVFVRRKPPPPGGYRAAAPPQPPARS